MKNFKNNFFHRGRVQVIIISAIIIAIIIVFAFLNREAKNQKYIDSLISKINSISKTSAVKEIKDEGYRLLDNVCNTDQCLFLYIHPTIPKFNYVHGVGRLSGYYTKYVDKSFWDEESSREEKTCDSLTITDGNQELIKTLVGMIDSGNHIYHKNELGQPVVNFSLKHLSKEQQNIFLNSTEDNPVEVVVSKTADERAPYYLCFTQMDIVSVREPR
jgi:hypothetical protein